MQYDFLLSGGLVRDFIYCQPTNENASSHDFFNGSFYDFSSIKKSFVGTLFDIISGFFTPQSSGVKGSNQITKPIRSLPKFKPLSYSSNLSNVDNSHLNQKICQISRFVYSFDPSVFWYFVECNQNIDIDVVTIHNPTYITKVLKEHQHFPKRAFATNTIYIDKIKIDITSTRVDTECDGMYAKMIFGVSYFRDSFRRDFTFNALYMDVINGLIFDFHNGLSHLMKNEIHFIGDTKTRIIEDYTRIKRYRNFCARFGMNNNLINDVIDYVLTNNKSPIKMR